MYLSGWKDIQRFQPNALSIVAVWELYDGGTIVLDFCSSTATLSFTPPHDCQLLDRFHVIHLIYLGQFPIYHEVADIKLLLCA